MIKQSPSQARAYRINFIQHRIADLTLFHHRGEEWISRELKRLKKRSDRLDRLPSDHQIAREEFYSDERFALETVFIRTLRYSVLATALTILETSLNEVCTGEQESYGRRVALTDSAGQGITRARLYLNKICGVRFPDNTAAWRRMALLSDIRNIISHADGHVDHAKSEIREKLRNIAKNTPGLEIRNAYLEVSDKFVRDTLSSMNEFFSELHMAFPAKLKAT